MMGGVSVEPEVVSELELLLLEDWEEVLSEGRESVVESELFGLQEANAADVIPTTRKRAMIFFIGGFPF